ncbi:hypothetical protein DY000_02020743 [Brassica cretica]|uniref:BED-type domain-containing protein n=1 Tax=Brassica cretica TaxID=69181 RepID=A0ABQ7E9H9_BRACR|nr:hypothetical protein DY000_02020743 [Brassica cretica]
MEDELGEEEREERQRSDVWKDFTVVHKPNGKMKAACNHCKREAWTSLDEEALDEDELGEEEMEERQQSDVWKDFTVVHKPNGKMKAACNHCKREYAWQSHSHGTSGLRRHHMRYEEIDGDGEEEKVPSFESIVNGEDEDEEA